MDILTHYNLFPLSKRKPTQLRSLVIKLSVTLYRILMLVQLLNGTKLIIKVFWGESKQMLADGCVLTEKAIETRKNQIKHPLAISVHTHPPLP